MKSLFQLDAEIVHAMESFGTQSKNTISSKNFKDSLAILLQRYNSFLTAFSKFHTNDLQKLADRIYATKNNIPNQQEGKACQIYTEIVASAKDAKGSRMAFDGIVKAAKAIENVLKNFNTNANIVMGSDTISISNAKLSHASAIGVMEQAEQFMDYSNSLLFSITNEIAVRNGVKELNAIPPYRYKFLEDFKASFISTLTNFSGGKHNAYLSAFKKLKQSKDDIFLGSKMGGSNLDYMSDATKGELDRNLFGTWSLNPFRWLGEKWNVIRHNKYVKMAAEKEELMAHVSLLQMELAEKDPNSKEYAKAVKIIDSYNQMIAELDQKINAYYAEED
jgi:hypothetical protein